MRQREEWKKFMEVQQTLIETDLRFSLVPEWVLDADISARAIQCYAVLARYADSNSGEAFPSRATVAARMRCGVKAVDRAVAELVAISAIEKRVRIVENKYSTSIYVVKRSRVRVGSKMTPPSVTSDTTLGSKMTHRTRTNEVELLNKQRDFEKFWDAYPKKDDKRRAEQAFFNAVKRTDVDTLMAGVAQYRDDPARKPEFTKNPATWLNADAWGNAPLVAPEPLNEYGKPFAKAAVIPGQRDWVRASHDRGEHFECRPGEFPGC
jgi:Mg-chelatase subunit ChlI